MVSGGIGSVAVGDAAGPTLALTGVATLWVLVVTVAVITVAIFLLRVVPKDEL